MSSAPRDMLAQDDWRVGSIWMLGRRQGDAARDTGLAVQRLPRHSAFIAKSNASIATAQSMSSGGKSRSPARCLLAARLVLTAATTESRE